MSDRDCPHGHQLGKCDTCDLIVAERHIAVLAQRIAELEGDQTIPYESMLADLRGQLCDLQATIKALREEATKMVEALDKLARLGNEPCLGNSIGNDIAINVLHELGHLPPPIWRQDSE